MTDTNRHLEIMTRFIDAVGAGDIDAAREIYHPDAVIWHNYDGIEQSAEENLAVLGWMSAKLAGFRYEEIRLSATAEGAVEQHVTVMPLPTGEELRMPACIVVQIDDAGRITRLDEYLDGVQVQQLQRAVAAAAS